MKIKVTDWEIYNISKKNFYPDYIMTSQNLVRGQTKKTMKSMDRRSELTLLYKDIQMVNT